MQAAFIQGQFCEAVDLHDRGLNQITVKVSDDKKGMAGHGTRPGQCEQHCHSSVTTKGALVLRKTA